MLRGQGAIGRREQPARRPGVGPGPQRRVQRWSARRRPTTTAAMVTRGSASRSALQPTLLLGRVRARLIKHDLRRPRDRPGRDRSGAAPSTACGLVLALHRGPLLQPVQQRVEIVGLGDVVLAQRLGQPSAAPTRVKIISSAQGENDSSTAIAASTAAASSAGRRVEVQQPERLQIGHHLAALVVPTRG